MIHINNESENFTADYKATKSLTHVSNRTFGTDITNSYTGNSLQSKTDTQVSDYTTEILGYLHETEEAFMPKAGYMAYQEKINEKMRSILIDWLVEVHFKFKLTDETLFLTVNIIDRFLQSTQVPKENLQLVGVSSMLIACKYEEIYPPEVKDFVYITDNTYTAQQVLFTESFILKTLNFNLTVPSSFRFLQRYSTTCELDEFCFNFARYVLELSLVDYRFLKFRPSVLAVAAIYCSQKILKPGLSDFTQDTIFYEIDVKTCAKEMLFSLAKAEASSLQGVRKKFLSERYLGVARTQVKI